MTGPLAGSRILVPESRELRLFAGMLEKAGASVRRCPLVTILDVPDDGPVAEWIGRLVEGGSDDLVLYTGEGATRLAAAADRLGRGPAFRAALGKVRLVVRGPKPTRALRLLGLSPDLAAEPATTGGLIDLLGRSELDGRRIAVQLHPDHSPDLLVFLAGRGARVDPVVPYRYAAETEDAEVLDAIRAMADRAIDIVAFTSTPQVRRLEEVAARHGAGAQLAAVRDTLPAAAIGPVTGDALAAAGWRHVHPVPETFHLKPMIALLARLAKPAPPAAAPMGARPT